MPRFFIALALLAFMSTSAKAGTVIYNLDFDTNPNGMPEFINSGGNANTSLTVGPGPTGDAAIVTFDPTLGGGFLSASAFAQLGDNNVDLLTAGTSTAISDYVFSFDAFATGFTSGTNSVFSQAMFQVDGTTFVSNVTIPGGITDQLQTFTFPLDPALAVPGAFFGNQTGRPTFQIQILGVQNAFDNPASTLVLDNFQIIETVTVPEPSSIALFSIGIAGLSLRRRR